VLSNYEEGRKIGSNARIVVGQVHISCRNSPQAVEYKRGCLGLLVACDFLTDALLKKAGHLKVVCYFNGPGSAET
jgi:hypothetical protein